jgi:hypothetical protein
MGGKLVFVTVHDREVERFTSMAAQIEVCRSAKSASDLSGRLQPALAALVSSGSFGSRFEPLKRQARPRHFRRIFSIAFPFASSSISLSR